MSDTSCKITGTVGITVQTSLSLLIPIVLLSEYFYERFRYNVSKSKSNLNNTHYHSRTFRTFWFDSYKICAGALVSHIFNVAVSIIVNDSSTSSDECAVYALAFYYETCGVPFVQLLQYSFIQYSLKMSSNPNISKNCIQRWKYITQPGLYSDKNRYQISDCLHCRSCHEKHIKRLYWKIFAIGFVTVIFSVISGIITWLYYGSEDVYVEISIGILVFVFVTTTVLAPISAQWQTLGWVGIKFTEKLIWSLFAISQSNLFAKWSNFMSTGDSTLDAWLFLAIIPIILNTFMFFMFSRISRLTIPCFKTNEIRKSVLQMQDMQIRKQSQSRSISRQISLVIKDSNNYNLMNDKSMSDCRIVDGYKIEDAMNDESVVKFDKSHAFKVGIVFMLIINVTLLVIALVYLLYSGAGNSVWYLILTMIGVPFVCGFIAIQIFDYIINGLVNVFGCCCFADGMLLNDSESVDD